MVKKSAAQSEPSKTEQKGALHKLFSRQQPKIGAKPATGRLLKSFAEEDYRRIARLIQKWLDESDKHN
ncbi:hypothetical protein [Bowmanella denitrificans]|uniref:hypothetical protein n=1 Tax=Bowmanella denitrificans TaxID=366582 RepID=UPI000C9CC00C|nr:hypothetical protein [Bowmanella denitrificans]